MNEFEDAILALFICFIGAVVCLVMASLFNGWSL